MRLALYQPDIAQNTGAILRLSACLGLTVDIIGPCGFSLSDKALRRAGLDYVERASFRLFDDFGGFFALRVEREQGRLIAATSRGETSHLEHEFGERDVILMGRESCGLPENIRELAHTRIKIPMREGERSLNLAIASAIICAEAMRQLDLFPPMPRA
jgi:tRNA (cytidine/uridine-2'-O-)-methyltransferase